MKIALHKSSSIDYCTININGITTGENGHQDKYPSAKSFGGNFLGRWLIASQLLKKGNRIIREDQRDLSN